MRNSKRRGNKKCMKMHSKGSKHLNSSRKIEMHFSWNGNTRQNSEAMEPSILNLIQDSWTRTKQLELELVSSCGKGLTE